MYTPSSLLCSAVMRRDLAPNNILLLTLIQISKSAKKYRSDSKDYGAIVRGNLLIKALYIIIIIIMIKPAYFSIIRFIIQEAI